MTRVKRHVVQFFARKRDADGDRCQWHHGPFTADEAIAHAAKMRGVAAIRGLARVEIVPPVDHAERTRAGMAIAAAAGKSVGRPRSVLNIDRAREILAAWTRVHGRTEGLRIAAGMLRVSVSTLERAMRGKDVGESAPSKGAASNVTKRNERKKG